SASTRKLSASTSPAGLSELKALRNEANFISYESVDISGRAQCQKTYASAIGMTNGLHGLVKRRFVAILLRGEAKVLCNRRTPGPRRVLRESVRGFQYPEPSFVVV